MPAVVDKAKCEGCEECVPSCPTEAIVMVDTKAYIDPEKCEDCEACIDVCPPGAISMQK